MYAFLLYMLSLLHVFLFHVSDDTILVILHVYADSLFLYLGWECASLTPIQNNRKYYVACVVKNVAVSDCS